MKSPVPQWIVGDIVVGLQRATVEIYRGMIILWVDSWDSDIARDRRSHAWTSCGSSGRELDASRAGLDLHANILA